MSEAVFEILRLQVIEKLVILDLASFKELDGNAYILNRLRPKNVGFTMKKSSQGALIHNLQRRN